MRRHLWVIWRQRYKIKKFIVLAKIWYIFLCKLLALLKCINGENIVWLYWTAKKVQKLFLNGKKAVVEWFPENDPHKAEWPLLSLWSFPPNTIHWQRGQKVSVLVESDVRKTSQRICSDKKNYITWDFRQNCNSHINVLCYNIFLVFWFDTFISIFSRLLPKRRLYILLSSSSS